MTDAELHREEFLNERVGMILEDQPAIEITEAMIRAVEIWNAMQELAKTAQEATNDLD